MANLRANKITSTEVFETTGSVQFDGSGDYLTLTSSGDFDFSGDFTIETWFYASSITIRESLISKGNTTSIGSEVWTLEFNASNELSFFACDASASTPIVKATTIFSTNIWYHISVSRFNGTTKIFVNGIEEDSSTTSYTVSSGGNLYIGAGWYEPTARDIDGHISNVRVLKGTALYTTNKRTRSHSKYSSSCLSVNNKSRRREDW